MAKTPQHEWLKWAQAIQAIAQNGQVFTKNPFDIDRYRKLELIAAEMIAGQSSVPTEKLTQIFHADRAFATPKVEVRAIVIKNGKILLMQERADQLWAPPGGFADVGDTPTQAALRELEEETGIQGRALRLLSIYDINLHGHPPRLPHTYKLFIHCEPVQEVGRSELETLDVGYFGRNELPPLSPPRVTREEVLRVFDIVEKNLPTEID